MLKVTNRCKGKCKTVSMMQKRLTSKFQSKCVHRECMYVYVSIYDCVVLRKASCNQQWLRIFHYEHQEPAFFPVWEPTRQRVQLHLLGASCPSGQYMVHLGGTVMHGTPSRQYGVTTKSFGPDHDT